MPRWEPPDPQKLLVSCARVAEELDVPIWKANEMCWGLERVFYAEGGVNYRVTRRSLDAFKQLLETGLSWSAARSVMWHYKGRERLPPEDLSLDAGKRIDWHLRRYG